MNDPHAENRRLYRLDEAAVGPEKAPKRWQFKFPSSSIWFDKHKFPPDWNPDIEYCRDPEALPLPSLIWHEAPDWALYRHVNENGAGWLSNVPTGRGWFEYRERRPNKEWFELTRPDYEAWKNQISKELDKGIPESDYWDIVEESNMTEEYLTGPDLMYAIAEAQKNYEGPETFELKPHGEWITGNSWWSIIATDEDNKPVRRKPRIRSLKTQDGQWWEWPEPLKEMPGKKELYYYICLSGDTGVRLKAWENSEEDQNNFYNHVCFKEGDSARIAYRALAAALKGGES